MIFGDEWLMVECLRICVYGANIYEPATISGSEKHVFSEFQWFPREIYWPLSDPELDLQRKLNEKSNLENLMKITFSQDHHAETFYRACGRCCCLWRVQRFSSSGCRHFHSSLISYFRRSSLFFLFLLRAFSNEWEEETRCSLSENCRCPVR